MSSHSSTRSRFGRFMIAGLVLLAAACRDAPPRDPAAFHALPPVVITPLAVGTPCTRFLAVGDTGTGRAGQREVAAVMAQRAERDGCDFVLLLGDNFYPSGVEAPDDPRFERDFEEVYAKPALDVPFFVTLGNHDHAGSIDAQIRHTQLGTRWRMPDRHYTFERRLEDGTTLGFFAIDTTPIVDAEPESAAEIAWLAQALAASSARWKIVFGHHPLRSATKRGPIARMVAQVEPILQRFHVQLYLSGHDHCLELLPARDGLVSVVAGGGAGRDNPSAVEWTDAVDYAATNGGFTALRASHDSLLIEFVRMDGATQFAYELHPGEVRP